MASSRENLLNQFRELVGERLERVGRSLVELESGPSQEAGRSALRELHGLKGEARMLGLSEVNRLVHEMEGVVRSTESIDYALTGGSTDALLVASDAVLALAGGGGPIPELDKLVEWLRQRADAEARLHGVEREDTERSGITARAAANLSALVASTPVEEASANEPPPPRAGRRRRRGGERSDGVRIGQHELDALTTTVTQLLHFARRRELLAERRLSLTRELARIARAIEDLGPEGAATAARLMKAKEQTSELHRERKLLASEELRYLGLLSDEVQAIRMVPLVGLFESYPRMVRDLARELGKDVDLIVEGEDTRADRSVIEALREPLLHLARNALDHGIEPPERRAAVGKPPRGALWLRASREAERILIKVEDDGAGLDPVALRQIAVRRGLLDEAGAAALSDSGARELVFLPGFSSKDVPSDISGRGVGLEAVRVRLHSLGGEVVVHSKPGEGACFELRVPVSLTVAPLLFLQAGGERLALTASHVVSAFKVDPSQIAHLAGRPAVSIHGESYPFAALTSLLGTSAERPPLEGELVLLVRGHGSVAAISVDRVLEERVQAILPLKGVLSRFGHLSGATQLADGSVAIVLSAPYLVAAARGVSAGRLVTPIPEARAERRRILVVDDSPLTRELLSSLLESAGYDVASARDGAEALEALATAHVDLVVSDLEMPNVDGLELTRRLKGEGQTAGLPVVLVTTRSGEADRRRGLEAGADAYLTKGDLVRQDLVDVVDELLERRR